MIVRVFFTDSKIDKYNLRKLQNELCDYMYVYDGKNGWNYNINKLKLDQNGYPDDKEFLIYTNIPEFMNFSTFRNGHKLTYFCDDNRYLANVQEFTDREIREGHNIAKMYMNGVFDYE